MSVGIKIGHDADQVAELRKSVLAILNTKADQKTIQLALSLMKDSLKIGPVAITGCTIYTGSDNNKE